MLNFKRFATLLVVLLACTGLMMAQTVQGVITGTVTDTTGAVIPGATVTITNEGTNVSQTATSGGAGEYRFSLV
ncbi:MAG: carboxypeptidase-like regulatory domain-containing protein, partial [Terriglobales bacterium]